VGPLFGGRRSPKGKRVAVEPVHGSTLSRPQDLSHNEELRLATVVGGGFEAFFPEDAGGGSGVVGPRWLRHR
jgi:hypothetical protein